MCGLSMINLVDLNRGPIVSIAERYRTKLNTYIEDIPVPVIFGFGEAKQLALLKKHLTPLKDLPT